MGADKSRATFMEAMSVTFEDHDWMAETEWSPVKKGAYSTFLTKYASVGYVRLLAALHGIPLGSASAIEQRPRLVNACMDESIPLFTPFFLRAYHAEHVSEGG